MNYYERHIGDYLKDTAHLSLLEHGVYGRLLDVYYTREAPIPVEQGERLIGARAKDERAALAAVLDEFFTATNGLLHHSRCDREIARFQDKQRKASASANARWKKPEPQSVGNANASPDAMRTHSEGNAPSNQTPDPIPKESERAQLFVPSPAARIGQALIRGGLQATSFSTSNPHVIALAEQGATEQEVEDVAREGTAKGKGLPWIVATIRGRRADAATLTLAPPSSNPLAWSDTDLGVRAMAAQLGMKPKSTELPHEWVARVKHAWRRAGEPAPQPTETA